jgi:hypothetical protein
MALMYKAEEDGRSANIPAADLYDPSSKNWIGNVARPLVKTLEQRTADLNAKLGGTTTTAPAYKLPDNVPAVDKRRPGLTTIVGNTEYEWRADNRWHALPSVPMAQ